MIKTIIIICMLICLVGCKEDTPIADGVPSISCYNETKVFLYPSINLDSNTPEFFEKTEYEVIRNGKYFGRYNGSMNNESMLILQPSDKIDLVISAEGDCFVYNDVLHKFVEDAPIEYIIPESKCAKKLRFEVEGDYDLPIDYMNNTIKSYYDDVSVNLDIEDNERYDYIACFYNRTLIDKFILEDIEEYNYISPEWLHLLYPHGDYHYDAYEIGNGEYELIFEIRDYNKFKTNVICTFYDRDWYLRPHSYDIVYDIQDDDYNDLGQENPSFNFTIIQSG